MAPGRLEEQFDHAVHQLVRLTNHLNIFVTDRIHGHASRPVTQGLSSRKISGIQFSSKLQCYTSSRAQCPPRVIYMQTPFASLSTALTGAGSLGGPTGKATNAAQGRGALSLSSQRSSGAGEETDGTEEDESDRILISEVQYRCTLL